LIKNDGQPSPVAFSAQAEKHWSVMFWARFEQISSIDILQIGNHRIQILRDFLGVGNFRYTLMYDDPNQPETIVDFTEYNIPTGVWIHTGFVFRTKDSET
jgi:hypothetical protein